MAQVHALDGVVTVVHPSAFVHPSAVLIGGAIVGERCNVGPCTSLRADFGRIVLKDGAVFEDGYIFHGGSSGYSMIHEDAVIGHGAVLHICEVRRCALVGIAAIVLDGAIVGEEAFVGAKALVKADFQVPPRKLVTGIPGRVRRDISAAELAYIDEGIAFHQDLARRSLVSLTPCDPLVEATSERARQSLT